MRFVDSRCIHCGATLRVAQDAAHICCQYCKAELIVVREGAAVTTQMLGEMNENLGQKLDVLRVQNELERLDREWTLQRESYMVSGQNGARSIPTGAGSMFGGLFIAVAGVAWTIFASSHGAPGFFTLFGSVLRRCGSVDGVCRDEQSHRARHGGSRLPVAPPRPSPRLAARPEWRLTGVV